MSTLFRVENPETMVGLWYNERGEKTDFILTIPNAQSAAMPMEFDAAVKDGGDWFSACDSLEDMRNWFSVQDVSALHEIGYKLYRLEVPNYRTTNGHAILLRESAIEIVEIPIHLLEAPS